MNWNAHHSRTEVLRAVISEADTRRDGILPMDTPGVAEIFGDELSLVAALQLRWYTRLAGTIERELMDQPMDLESAVLTAWRRTATELPGIHAILDTYSEAPTSEAMDRALAKAHRTEWTLLAVMAGRASVADRHAPAVGRALEQRARAAYRPTRAPQSAAAESHPSLLGPLLGPLLGRVKAHLAA